MAGLVGFAGLLFLMALLAASLSAWWRIAVTGAWSELKPLPVSPVTAEFRQRRAVLLAAVGLCWLLLPTVIIGLTGRPAQATLEHVQSTGLLLSLIPAVSAVAWLLATKVEPEASRRELLRRDGLSLEDWPDQLQAGVRGFQLSALPVAILAGIVHLLELRPDNEPGHSMLKLLQDDARISTVLQVALVVVVLAPLVEEWVFRVVLQGFLQISTPPGVAVVVSSLMFAVIHPWPNPIPLLPLALILGLLYQRENSAVAVVTVHALFNLTNLILFLLSSEAG